MDDTMVAPVRPRSNSQINLGGRNVAGSEGKAVQEGKQIVNRTGSVALGQQG